MMTIRMMIIYTSFGGVVVDAYGCWLQGTHPYTPTTTTWGKTRTGRRIRLRLLPPPTTLSVFTRTIPDTIPIFVSSNEEHKDDYCPLVSFAESLLMATWCVTAAAAAGGGSRGTMSTERDDDDRFIDAMSQLEMTWKTMEDWTDITNAIEGVVAVVSTRHHPLAVQETNEDEKSG